MKKKDKLSFRDIKSRLSIVNHPYPHLQFQLLPLAILLGNQILRKNIRNDMHLVKSAYDDPEFPKNFYYNLGKGFNYKVPLVTETLLTILGWKGGTQTEMKIWRQETARFIKDHAGLIKLNSEGRWLKNNIMNPGTLSLMLLLGVNLWKAKGKITSILHDVALESSAGLRFDYVKLFVLLSNGVHEDDWFKETSWDAETNNVCSILGGYLDFMAYESGLKKNSIASMIVRGVKTPSRGEVKEIPSVLELFSNSNI